MASATSFFGDVWLVRLVLQRGMAAIYLIAFLNVLLQFKPLLGDRGLLPVPEYLKRATFREAPSLFHWRYSDRILDVVAWMGLMLAASALFGLTEAGPLWISAGAWLLLWALYLSIVNVGQNFFGFGWESMLLEAGFFTAFLGPAHMQPPVLPVLMLRWMLFRTEIGAGLIKLRHDPCWRNLTCLNFHYETQPLPNPLSWYFHRLPELVHRASVLFSHFVQVLVPFFFFAPQPYASIAAALTMSQQFWLIISGNYSWLNWLTALLGVAGFSDEILAHGTPLAAPMLHPVPPAFTIVLYVLGAAVVLLSIQPVMNLLSRRQRMNSSYNRYHLVNTYGAFGNVGRERYEIVLEGTSDRILTPATEWKEYAFKGKPGDPQRRPPQIAPYHLRLDWMIWFLPFSVVVTNHGVHVSGYEIWFIRFVRRLLANEPATLALMRNNPFPAQPPAQIRALFYRYHYTTWQQKQATGAWWTRELLGAYLPAVSLDSVRDA